MASLRYVRRHAYGVVACFGNRHQNASQSIYVCGRHNTTQHSATTIRPIRQRLVVVVVIVIVDVVDDQTERTECGWMRSQCYSLRFTTARHIFGQRWTTVKNNSTDGQQQIKRPVKKYWTQCPNRSNIFFAYLESRHM